MKSVALMLAMTAFTVSMAAQDTVHRPGDGVSMPRVVKQVRPEYTDTAKAATIEGTVLVEAVVLSDGYVGNVSVLTSLDAGLDWQAVNATKQWTFEPGKRNGKPVAVAVQIEMTFSLR